MGPGPSSSHTMGPMRITRDFYRRVEALPDEVLARATGLRVEVLGSLSATGQGHGTGRAALAGLLGRNPADCEPEFLDGIAEHPERVYDVRIGPAAIPVSMKDIVWGEMLGNFPHPNTMRVRLLGGDATLLEMEYYSVGGGFIEWKGYQAPEKGTPAYPYSTMKELQAHVVASGMSLPAVMLANELAVSGKSEPGGAGVHSRSGEGVCRNRWMAGCSSVLPGPIGLQSKAKALYANAMESDRWMDRSTSVLASVAMAAAGGERALGSRDCDGAHGGGGGRDAGRGEGLSGLPADERERVSRVVYGGGGERVLVQAQRDAGGGGGRMPGGDRGGVGDGCGVYRAGIGREREAGGERGGIGAGTSSGADVRSGGGLCAGAMHRALRVWRDQGARGGVHHDGCGREAAQGGSGYVHRGDGDDGPRHEREVQGDVDGRAGGAGAVLRATCGLA